MNQIKKFPTFVKMAKSNNIIRFKATMKKFGDMGEKTGWTYIEIPENIASKLKPNHKTSFAVKGTLDEYLFRQVALLPMGAGNFIMALKADIRKTLGKRAGYVLDVVMEPDNSPFEFSEEFMLCLNDDPQASKFFQSLPFSHQKYFSKWIDSAKTTDTKAKRITMAINAMSRKMGYNEMIRENKKPNPNL